MTRIYQTLIMTLALVLTGLTVSSCKGDDRDNLPESGEGVLKIQFRILTKPNAATRAADIAGDLEGTGAENYLNLNNIRYLLFDKNKKYLSDLTPDVSTVVASDNYAMYDVVANVKDEYFKENINTTLDFYILILANYTSWGATLPTLTRGDDISMVFTNTPQMRFRPVTNSLMNAANPEITGTERQMFPMAGLQHFEIHGSLLEGHSQNMPLDLTTTTGKSVNLLRAVAKIEIIDHINIAPDEIFDEATNTGKIRIKEVSMNGFMERGNLLPGIAQWDRNAVFETQQVLAPNPAASQYYHIPPTLNADGTITATTETDYSLPFAFDLPSTAMREDKCRVYSCYVWEYSMNALSGITTGQLPYFTVTIAEYRNPETNEIEVEEIVIPMQMAYYTDGNPATRVTTLLRNHIYRFRIDGIGLKLNVNCTICAMDEAQGEIEFN